MPLSMTSCSILLRHAETVMQMAIQRRGFELTEVLHGYLSKRLACNSSHGAARIGGRVTVRRHMSIDQPWILK